MRAVIQRVTRASVEVCARERRACAQGGRAQPSIKKTTDPPDPPSSTGRRRPRLLRRTRPPHPGRHRPRRWARRHRLAGPQSPVHPPLAVARRPSLGPGRPGRGGRPPVCVPVHPARQREEGDQARLFAGGAARRGARDVRRAAGPGAGGVRAGPGQGRRVWGDDAGETKEGGGGKSGRLVTGGVGFFFLGSTSSSFPQVSLVNDGPVTLTIDSRDAARPAPRRDEEGGKS